MVMSGYIRASSIDIISSASQEISVSTLITYINGSINFTPTIADGVDGQIKIITMIVNGNTISIPTSSFGGNIYTNGFTYIQFANVGDSITLTYVSTLGVWVITGYNGVSTI